MLFKTVKYITILLFIILFSSSRPEILWGGAIIALIVDIFGRGLILLQGACHQ
jgi:hypothetical protein